MGAVCIFVFQSIMDKCRVKTLNLLSKIEFITSTLLTLAIVVTQQRIKQPDAKIKKELIQGTKITGIDNLQINQFLGDMYLDVDVTDTEAE